MPASVGLGRAKQYGVICVGLDVLLEILGSLEGFATEVALMRLQGHMHANMRSNVVAFYSRRSTVAPLAGQIQVIGALAANMALADMILRRD